ncbi:hypothetical protein BgAZ_501470 [Babesia gibsoni]|uniref:Ribosome recycling factor domain-containing protein n=1 Tax=Babesia gibsoni TaxID=33632 RepID=A0AAD8LFU6_BABGI|nr:hypothetical protein BgAZ_501470 [Babesia gibsoni]
MSLLSCSRQRPSWRRVLVFVSATLWLLTNAFTIATAHKYIATTSKYTFISHINRPVPLPSTAIHASKRKRNDRGRKGLKKGEEESDEEEDELEPGVSEEDLEEVFSAFRDKLKESEDFLTEKIGRLALHRATPSLIESITVELPGEKNEKQLQYVARIMSKGNYELHVVPLVPENLDAVFVSLSTKMIDYKVSMMQDRVSVVIPSMTEVMVRQARTIVKDTSNEVKVQMRVARQNAIKKLKKMHQRLSDDMFFRQQKQLDEILKKAEQNIDKISSNALSNLR